MVHTNWEAISQALLRLPFCCPVTRSRKGQGLSYLGGCILAEQTWHGVLGGLAIPQSSPPTWEAKVFSPSLWLVV